MTHTNHTLDDDLTEVTFMDTPRVDLVSKAANGYDFLLAKSAANPSMFTEDDVLELAKAQEGDMTDTTPTGSDENLEKDALDPETLLETPDVDADGDPTDPGSPAWEAVDAARATQAIELTVALKRLVETAAARESQEALVGDDPADADNAWSLGDVLLQLDCILGVLAPFAVTEQAEADGRSADDTLVLKSGRVLSNVNEGKVRQAQNLLGEVLANLPVVEDVAKGTDEEPVIKADEDQLTLVYTADGKVLGAVKATNITTFAATPAPEAADGTDAAADTGEATADQTAAVAAADDSKVIPGTHTVQSPAPTDDNTTPVTKGLDTEVLDTLKELTTILAKQAADGDLAGTVQRLEERIEKIAQSPDDRRSPLLNGATGIAGEATRGGSEDTQTELRKAIEETADPAQRRDLEQQLGYALIKARFQA